MEVVWRSCGGDCWHARPMSIFVTLSLAPGCSSWRLRPALAQSGGSPAAVTDSGRRADMQTSSWCGSTGRRQHPSADTYVLPDGRVLLIVGSA